MLARAEWEKQVQEAAEEEEEGLEVFDETESHANAGPDPGMASEKASTSTSLPADMGETNNVSEGQSGMSVS
jgi:hypothetical protein